MRYLSLVEILELHDATIVQTGGARGVRDLGALESAVNQPRITFDETDLYPDLVSKAAALCFYLVMDHPFIDGNKRAGHAAMEIFLMMNGFEINAGIDEQESKILALAAGEISLQELTGWLNKHIAKLSR